MTSTLSKQKRILCSILECPHRPRVIVETMPQRMGLLGWASGAAEDHDA